MLAFLIEPGALRVIRLVAMRPLMHADILRLVLFERLDGIQSVQGRYVLLESACLVEAISSRT